MKKQSIISVNSWWLTNEIQSIVQSNRKWSITSIVQRSCICLPTCRLIYLRSQFNKEIFWSNNTLSWFSISIYWFINLTIPLSIPQFLLKLSGRLVSIMGRLLSTYDHGIRCEFCWLDQGNAIFYRYYRVYLSSPSVNLLSVVHRKYSNIIRNCQDTLKETLYKWFLIKICVWT